MKAYSFRSSIYLVFPALLFLSHLVPCCFLDAVLLIALVTLGSILFILLLICIIMTCCRKKPQNSGVTNGMSFLPQRIATHSRRSTLDRRAMIADTSSESGQSDTNTLPYVAKVGSTHQFTRSVISTAYCEISFRVGVVPVVPLVTMRRGSFGTNGTTGTVRTLVPYWLYRYYSKDLLRV